MEENLTVSIKILNAHFLKKKNTHDFWSNNSTSRNLSCRHTHMQITRTATAAQHVIAVDLKGPNVPEDL